MLSLLLGLGLGCLSCLLDGEGLLSCGGVSVADGCGSLSTMARPNSREADNRARAGRQGRTSGASNRSVVDRAASFAVGLGRGVGRELYGMAESQQATFVAPAWNQTVGRVAPGLRVREAGGVESAINTAAALAGPFGKPVAQAAGRAVTRGGRVGRVISNVRGVDVGVHVSPTSGLRQIVPPSGTRVGSGMGPTPKQPVIPGVSYKVSGSVGRFLPKSNKPNVMANRSIGLGDTSYSSKGFSAYVTRSKTGKVDPETPLSPLNKITGKQNVVSEVKFPSFSSAPENFGEWGRIPKTAEGKKLVSEIKNAQAKLDKESLSSAVSGAVSGASKVVVAGSLTANSKKKNSKRRRNVR